MRSCLEWSGLQSRQAKRFPAPESGQLHDSAPPPVQMPIGDAAVGVTVHGELLDGIGAGAEGALVHAVALGEVTAPVKAELVCKRHQRPHRTLGASNGRHGSESVPRHVDVERATVRMR